ncbi:MAG: CRISPR-associated endonuclease Cas2 [Omnitrophica bacterium GWA2_52_12]|nr:MAG: CRISPR-associated endonuclease Cas2 [Omnitrophica bacterium GWA2_52_12]
MMVLVSYDVSTKDLPGRRRLRKVADACQDFGQRVQNSVFECIVDPAQWVVLKNRVLGIYKPEEDSIRFYFMGSSWQKKVEHYGIKATPDLEKDSLIV